MNSLRATGLVALLVVGGSAACGPLTADLAIEEIDVVTMTDRGVLRDHTVLVADGRITRMGASADLEVPAGALRIDGEGRTLIPGLVDAHVHLLDADDLPLLLAHGVTSVLNMSGAPLQLGWREAVARGELLGPAISTTGPQLKVHADPIVDFERSATSPAGARRLVEHGADAGYDFIKVWGPLAGPVYDAVIQTARERGIRVTGHIPREVGLEAVLDADRYSIAHIEEYYNKVFDGRVDPSRLHAVAARTAERDVRVITTLVTYEAIAASVADDPRPLLERPERALLDPVRRLLWEPDFNRHRTPDRVGEDDVFLEALASQMLIARRLHEAGVPLLAGSDAGELPGLVPGDALHRELELLVAAGLAPLEALASATSRASRYLSPDDERGGTIVEGAPADLVLLDESPLEDIRNTRRIALTVVRGRPLRPDSLLAEVDARNEATRPFVELVLAGDLDGAREHVRSRSAAGRRLPAETPMLFLAYVLSLAGDPESAFEVLRMAAETHPESYLPLYMLGAAALGAGLEQQGREALERVLVMVPDHDGARALLER